MLYVSFDESVLSATRISSLYSFTSVITGAILGLVVIKVRQLKPFIVFGTMLFTVAFGILIYYRGGPGGSSHSGVIGGQVLLGLGMMIFHSQFSQFHRVSLISPSRWPVFVPRAGEHPSSIEARA